MISYMISYSARFQMLSRSLSSSGWVRKLHFFLKVLLCTSTYWVCTASYKCGILMYWYVPVRTGTYHFAGSCPAWGVVPGRQPEDSSSRWRFNLKFARVADEARGSNNDAFPLRLLLSLGRNDHHGWLLSICSWRRQPGALPATLRIVN